MTNDLDLFKKVNLSVFIIKKMKYIPNLIKKMLFEDRSKIPKIR
jgi:hypothetical protein